MAGRRHPSAGRGAVWVLVAVLCGWSAAAPLQAADAIAMHAAWAPVQAGQDAAALRHDVTLKRFDASRYSRIPRGHRGAWVRLAPAAGRWPHGPLLLAVGSPALGPVTLLLPGRPPQHARLQDLDRDAPHGFDRLLFRLPASMPRDAVLVLRLDPYDGASPPMDYRVQRPGAFQRADLRRQVLAAAAFAAMLATALIALVFALLLRDATFVLYALYVGGYVVLQSVQSGFAFYPLELSWVAAHPTFVGRLATGVSGAAAMFFLTCFVDLRRLAPRWHRLLAAFGFGLLGIALIAVTGVPALEALARALINPWLLVCAVLMLVSAALALRRGSRYGGYFLIGWTPLLLCTALGSMQDAGALAGWTSQDLTAIAAGAFEALALSLGLADRALALRHDRDRALEQAHTDELTRLPNRRAWTERLQQLATQAQADGRALAVLFVDLDHFKRLNDALGHQVGDRVLVAMADAMRQVLRPVDVIGRYGGEEFTVVLPECSRGYALQVAERLRRQIAGTVLEELAGAPAMSASIGVAMLAAGESLESLLRRADEAMYAAKTAGRNRVQLAI